MAKALLEAEVAANIGPFERSLKQATEKAREFASQTKDAGKDVLKELTGLNLDKTLGLGLAGAAAAFGLGLVEAVKKGMEAFSEFEQVSLRIKENLAHPEMANEITERIEKSSGAAGAFPERGTAYSILTGMGFKPEGHPEQTQEEINAANITAMQNLGKGGGALPSTTTAANQNADVMLKALDNWAIKNGETQDEMANTLRMLKAGGAEEGEGVTRALKSFKGLDQALQPNLENFRKLSGTVDATLQDMAKAHALNFGQISTAIVAGAGHGVEDKSHTWEGIMENLSARFTELYHAIGAALAPDLEKYAQQFTDAMPSIIDAVTAFAESAVPELDRAIEGLTAYINGVIGRTQQIQSGIDKFVHVFDKVTGIKGIVDSLAELHKQSWSARDADKQLKLDPVVQQVQRTNALLQDIALKVSFPDVQ